MLSLKLEREDAALHTALRREDATLHTALRRGMLLSAQIWGGRMPALSAPVAGGFTGGWGWRGRMCWGLRRWHSECSPSPVWAPTWPHPLPGPAPVRCRTRSRRSHLDRSSRLSSANATLYKTQSIWYDIFGKSLHIASEIGARLLIWHLNHLTLKEADARRD